MYYIKRTGALPRKLGGNGARLYFATWLFIIAAAIFEKWSSFVLRGKNGLPDIKRNIQFLILISDGPDQFRIKVFIDTEYDMRIVLQRQKRMTKSLGDIQALS